MTTNIYPARPDQTKVSGTLLQNPTEGQFWYNTSNRHMYAWNGFEWIPIMNRDDYAANWGQVSHGQRIPRPVSTDGYVFDYDECIWTTSPTVLGKFDSFVCYADSQGVVTAQYRPTGGSTFVDGVANYLIIGIRGNHNRGVVVAPPIPSQTPTVTPTSGASPTPTPTLSESVPLITPSVTSTIGASTTPSPSMTRTPEVTPTPTHTVTPTPSVIPPLVVAVSDPEGSTDAASLTSYCDLGIYDSYSRDSGYSGCAATTISTCATGTCSPEPGDNGLGPVMRIMVSGGRAPYTVRLKNFNYSDYYAIVNSNFELGDTGWTKESGWSIVTGEKVYSGSWSAKYDGVGSASIIAQAKPVIAGRTVTATARIYTPPNAIISAIASARINLNWYNASMVLISTTQSPTLNSGADAWEISSVTGTAPTNAKFVAVSFYATKFTGGGKVYIDNVTWNLGNNGTPECFFVGGASVPVIPYAGTVKTYSIALSGQTTPIITLNGICGSLQFSMSGSFDIEVEDSRGTIVTTTKRWEIYRTGYPPSSGGGGGGGCVVSDARIYQLGTASSAAVGNNIATYDATTGNFGVNTITYAQPIIAECVRVITSTGIRLECSTSAPLALADGSQVLAPQSVGETILIFRDGSVSTDTVSSVEYIGLHEVMHISCQDSYFLASTGVDDGTYILHHNKMAPPEV